MSKTKPTFKGDATANHLYYGDNLQVLRDSIADESIDLFYLDPPFNSQANHNVLFKAPTGEQSKAQIEAFEDTWHWNTTAERDFDEVMQSGFTDVSEMLRAMPESTLQSASAFATKLNGSPMGQHFKIDRSDNG